MLFRSVRKIDVQALDISLEEGGVVAGVEEDALSFELDERGVAPVLFERGIFAEGVIQDGDSILRGQMAEEAMVRIDRRSKAERFRGHRIADLL